MFFEKDERILDKMEKHRQEAVEIVARHVDTKHAEDFTQALVSAYLTNCIYAESLIEKLCLSQKHIFAITENYFGFLEELLKNDAENQLMAMGE